MQKERGYRDLQDVIAKNETLSAGDKVYAVNKEKAVVLYHIGKEPLEKGMNILGAHIDSPRLDIKQVPLYEDSELVLMDTHYYGGIKKISVGCTSACLTRRSCFKRRQCRGSLHW